MKNRRNKNILGAFQVYNFPIYYALSYEPGEPRGVTGRIPNQPSVMAGYLDLRVEHGKGAPRRTWRSPGRHCVSFCVVTVLSDRCITAAVEPHYTGSGEAALGVRKTISRSVS